MRTAFRILFLCLMFSPAWANSESLDHPIDPVIKKPAALKRCVTVHIPAGAPKGCNWTDQRIGVDTVKDQPAPKAAREAEPLAGENQAAQ